jgi:MFS family permease
MLLFFKPPKRASNDATFLKKVSGLDLIGNLLFLGAAIMFFLALQLNESGLPWSSSRIIGLFVGSGVTTIAFVAWQWHRGDRALIPPRIVLQRSVAASCIAAFSIYGTMLLHAYYLPIWFQAVKGDSAIASGVSMVAYMLANALFSLLAGAIVTKVGYFTPPAIIGSAIGVVGCGLLSTFQVDTPAGKWIGYQILASAGLGIAIQQGFIAVQTVLSMDQVSIGVAAIVCFQSLGGAVFVSVGNSILQNELLGAAASSQLPDIDIQAVIAAGVTRFRSIVPPEALPALLVAYNSALQKVFIAAIPLSGLAFVAALGLEWKSVREKRTNLEASHASTSRISAAETLGVKDENQTVQSEGKPEQTT